MKDLKLKEQERIVDEVRKYGLVTIWRWILGFLFITTGFFFIFWLMRHDWWGQSLFGLLIFIGLFTMFRTFFLWKKNVLYVTTHRLIDIEQRGFLERIVSEVPHDQIEDIHGRVKGFWGTVFQYGNVEIQTGNGKVKIIVEKIKRPLQLQQQMNEMRERYLSKYAHEFSGDVAGAIVDKLYELEMPELVRVRKAVEKRMGKLGKE